MWRAVRQARKPLCRAAWGTGVGWDRLEVQQVQSIIYNGMLRPLQCLWFPGLACCWHFC